jgi:hypothetical protein
MSFSENGCGASCAAGHVQSHRRRSEGDSVLCATEDCAEFGLGAARQSILHIQDQVSEFFLAAARSFGKVCLMVGSPILAR